MGPTAPDMASATSYGSAIHAVVTGIQLGAAVDVDISAIGTPAATGDGADDDAINLPEMIPGTSITTWVSVNQLAANDGYLQGWIDWNGDGDFSDSGEQVCTDLQYGAGTSGTITVAVTTPVTAATTQTFARFRWSTTAGLDSTSAADSGEVEDYAFTITAGGKLAARKEVEVWDPSSAGLYAIPGNDVRYTLSADNTGAGPIDTDTIVMIDEIPENVIFYNGDVDDAGSETQPVSFSQTSGAGLTFTYATDVAFSDSADKPVNFAACLYTPSSGYDINVTYICINPKGALAAGTPTPSFSVNFRAQIQ